MDAATLRETVIRPKLIESFGKMLASTILIAGTSAGMSASDDGAKKQAIVDAICGNDKVISMWGSKVNKLKREWMAA
jgi:hypothetical protein